MAKVYVSSTFADLKRERVAVMNWLRLAFPAGDPAVLAAAFAEVAAELGGRDLGHVRDPVFPVAQDDDVGVIAGDDVGGS